MVNQPAPIENLPASPMIPFGLGINYLPFEPFNFTRNRGTYIF